MTSGELFDDIEAWVALSQEERDERYRVWSAQRTAEIRAELGPRYPGDISAVKPTIPIANSLGGRSRGARGPAESPERERPRDDIHRSRDTQETPEHE